MKDDISSTTLTFDICADNYTKCGGDSNSKFNSFCLFTSFNKTFLDACEIVNITKTLIYKADSKYINIATNGVCAFRINLECGENDGFIKNDDVKITPAGRCGLGLYLRSKMACDEQVCKH